MITELTDQIIQTDSGACNLNSSWNNLTAKKEKKKKKAKYSKRP